MLSCDKEGTEVRKDFLVSKAISSEGGKSLFSFDFLIYTSVTKKKRPFFYRYPFPLTITIEGSKLLK